MDTVDSYDDIPYQSTPYHETHPGFLAPLTRLFGLDAAAPESCRVLELGCAGGGNLIPMAWHLPGSQFLGLELSPLQARAGAELVEHLGLTNCEIRQGDILEFGPGEGAFDYIIAHGVYSWSPPEVREKLLAICRDHLSEHGVAYISYNTLPGWRTRGMLRDMLLYHTRELTVPAQRLAAAERFIERLLPALQENGALSSRQLAYEIERIRKHHPSYLFHEYLESYNEPFLFSDFVAEVERHNLRYVCDSELHTLFPATLGEAAAELLDDTPDNTALWQHMDFLVNRNFRQSILCRGERVLSDGPDMDVFVQLAFHGDLRPPAKVDLRKSKGAAFTAADGSEHRAHHPLTKAALVELRRVYPGSLAFADLARRAADAVQAAGNAGASHQVDHLAYELFGFYAHQALGASLQPEPPFAPPGARPRAHALARAQAPQAIVATVRHASLNLDDFSVRLIELLDGTRDTGALKAALESGEAPAQSGPRPPSRQSQNLSTNIERLIALFARHGLLATGPT